MRIACGSQDVPATRPSARKASSDFLSFSESRRVLALGLVDVGEDLGPADAAEIPVSGWREPSPDIQLERHGQISGMLQACTLGTIFLALNRIDGTSRDDSKQTEQLVTGPIQAPLPEIGRIARQPVAHALALLLDSSEAMAGVGSGE